MKKTPKKVEGAPGTNEPVFRERADQAVVALFQKRLGEGSRPRAIPAKGHLELTPEDGWIAPPRAARARELSVEQVGARAPASQEGAPPGIAWGKKSVIRDWEDAGGEWDPLGPGSGGWRA